MLEQLAAGLPGLWHAATSNKDRKRLLRTLIANVTLLPETDPAQARVGIRWHTGATDELVVDRPLPPGPAKHSPSLAVELIRQLGPTTVTPDRVDKLNAAGLTTGHGRPFDIKAVQWIRHAYHIPAPNPYADNETSVAEAARRLGCTIGVVYDWIKTGKLAARRGTGNRLCIPGPNTPRSPAVVASPRPGTSTPPPAAPELTAHCRCHQTQSRSATAHQHHRREDPNTRLQEGQYEVTVPTIADRVVQAALKLVLEPIFEADFQPVSYGFRPIRRARRDR